MLRCQENDIAIVLAGPYIGFTVTVGKFVGDGRDLWLVRNQDIEDAQQTSNIFAPDRCLQPIRGRGTDQTTTTKKEMRA